MTGPFERVRAHRFHPLQPDRRTFTAHPDRLAPPA
jgi:hypothetical protein